MNIRCEAALAVLTTNSLVKRCEALDDALRIVTWFEHPGGDLIEMFLIEKGGQLLITDYGETLRMLHAHDFDPGSSPTRESIFEHVLRTHRAEVQEGTIEMRIDGVEDLANGLLRYVQATMKAGELLTHARPRVPGTFNKEVAEYLEQRETAYESEVVVKGKIEEHTVGFALRNGRRTLIEPLSTSSPQYADQLVLRAFAMWYDIKHAWESDGQERLVSLLDDRNNVWRPHRLQLLAEMSDVVKWVDRELLLLRT